MEKLKADLLELKEMDERLKKESKSLSWRNKEECDAFWSQAIKTVLFKQEIIKNEFTKSSVFVINDQEAKSVLQKINSGELFFADLVIRSLEEATRKKFNLEMTDWNELYEIASNELFSWFGPADYIQRLIEIGVLVIDIVVPKELEVLVEEARRCFAFERYIAVYSICRTILEVSIRDICLRIGKIQVIDDRKQFYEKYRPGKLIRLVSNGNFQMEERIKDLYYDRLSSIVHGLELSTSSGVQSTFKETMMVVQELYQNNQPEFSL